MEQRYQAVLEVLNDRASVSDVARRFGVTRQTVHDWLRRYAAQGLGGLADHSLTAPVVSASDATRRSSAVRRDASGPPGVGTAHDLALAGSGAGLIVAGADVGGALSGASRAGDPAGSAPEAVGLQAVGTSPGDGAVAGGHRRRCSSSSTASRRRSCRGSMTVRGSWCQGGGGSGDERPVCDAFADAMPAHGVPEQILTDNGKCYSVRAVPWRGRRLGRRKDRHWAKAWSPDGLNRLRVEETPDDRGSPRAHRALYVQGRRALRLASDRVGQCVNRCGGYQPNGR